MITVYEINTRRVRQITQQRRDAFDVELIPPHVRHLQAERAIDVEPHALALQDAQTLVLPVFVADVEEHLQTEADAEERLAALNVSKDRLIETLFAERRDRVLKRSDTRQ